MTKKRPRFTVLTSGSDGPDWAVMTSAVWTAADFACTGANFVRPLHTRAPHGIPCAYCGLWGLDPRCSGCGAPRDFSQKGRFTL